MLNKSFVVYSVGCGDRSFSGSQELYEEVAMNKFIMVILLGSVVCLAGCASVGSFPLKLPAHRRLQTLQGAAILGCHILHECQSSSVAGVSPVDNKPVMYGVGNTELIGLQLKLDELLFQRAGQNEPQ